ncbi:MAG: hypothetical protein ACREDO_01435 [Methyloceanibacter sp.]
MPGAEDRRDRKEATRLFVAVSIALALLIAIGFAGLYYLTGWVGSSSDPFAPGLGLKNAALISFGVSFVSILVMVIASGGDAIIGELPFTIAGFLIFFVVFWLMIAWIF